MEGVFNSSFFILWSKSEENIEGGLREEVRENVCENWYEVTVSMSKGASSSQKGFSRLSLPLNSMYYLSVWNLK